jgi:hypothetical protein
MIKKSVLMLVLLGVIVGSSFAQSQSESKPESDPKSRSLFSIGAGGYFSNDFGGGIKLKNATSEINPYLGGGFFVYFDATFAELSVGMLNGDGDFYEVASSSHSKRTFDALDIGLSGKLPIPIGEVFTFFPLVGVDYRLALNAKAGTVEFGGDRTKTREYLSALWFKAGAGLDFFFNESIYIRGNVMYGIRLTNKHDTERYTNNAGSTYLLGHGATIKLALGYRF